MSLHRRAHPIALVGLVLVLPSMIEAQVLGPFTWQLAPFCNLVTLTASSQGPVFALNGFDDNCGAVIRSAVNGTAVFNLDGTAALGFAIIGPGTVPSQTSVVLNLGTGSGTWMDSDGNAGTFLFNLGTPASGVPRPVRTVSAGGCAPDAVRAGTACVDKYEASVWQTTDPAVIQKIRLGTATLADLQNAGATQVGATTNNYAAAGCPATGAGCLNLYAVSLPGVTPSRFINWHQAVAVARNAGKRLPTNVEWQAAALGSPSGAPCVVSGSAPGPTGTAGCVSDVGAFDMTGNLSELTADFVPTASQIGPAACTAPPYCILERGGAFDVPAGPDVAFGSIATVSFGPDIGFRAAR